MRYYLKNNPRNWCEQNKGKDMVEPDQSMSLREIMMRSLSGVSPDNMLPETYDGKQEDFDKRAEDGEDIFDDPTREPGFDWVDAHNMERALIQRAHEYEKEGKKRKSEAAKKKAEQAKKDLEELAELRKQDQERKNNVTKN